MTSDPTFAAAHPELPLKKAYALRNALSHGSIRIDLEVVWSTVHHDLPLPHAAAKALLSRD